MKICYLKQADRPSNVILRITQKFKYMFKIIKIIYYNDKELYILPISENMKTSKQHIRKIVNKLNKKLKSNNIQKVALSKYLEQIDEIHENLEKNIIVLNGNTILNYLIEDAIEYILNIQNKNVKDAYISILVNNVNEINVKNIILLSKKVKLLNVITNNIELLKNTEEYLYNEFGIIIKVSNNRKKALLDANIIINIDYEEKMFNQYIINNKAVVININKSIKIKSRQFNGVNVTALNILIPKEKQLLGFRDEVIYESIIFGRFEDIKNIIKNDKIMIKDLIGINGIISKSELRNLLDKNRIVE